MKAMIETPHELRYEFTEDHGCILVHGSDGEPRNYLQEVSITNTDDWRFHILMDAGFSYRSGYKKNGELFSLYVKSHPLKIAEY